MRRPSRAGAPRFGGQGLASVRVAGKLLSFQDHSLGLRISP
ncbi:hypothetical protein FMEAI12_2870005 [Parafrankia sp. Ea1.12]|nr:hypothetical protein FMEAI12_2870005 [Parafrankia sp. Ea1.12]